LGISFKQVHASFELEGSGFKDVAVRYKGNGTFLDSRASLKRSLKVDLNKSVKGQKLAGATKLNFHSNVADPSAMNESVAYRLYRDAEVPAPRTAYAKVYLTVPGKYARQYLGLYSIVENVDEHFIVDRFGTKKGAMFKPVTPSLFADLGNDWSKYQQIYDAKTKVTAVQTQRVIDFARLLAHADDPTFAAQLPDYFDIDQLARYMAVTTYLSSLDSILCVGQNNYLYLDPRTNKFQFLPWDLDHAFGEIFGEQDRLARLSIQTPWVGSNRFLRRVYQVEAFKKAYLAHLAEFSRTIFKPERLHAQVDEIAAAIRPAVEAESRDKLSKFDAALAGASIKPAGGWFAPKPVKSIKGFVDVRTPEVLAQLEGKSKGEIVKGSGFERSNGRFGKAVVKSFMEKMHRDVNGQISGPEFRATFANWFSACDLDGDGKATQAELEKAIVKVTPMPALIPQSKPTTAPR
jgi:spore coat protein CotH